MYAHAHAEYPQVESEEEVLLPAGIVLRITGVLPRDASGLTIVTCEDDDDAPEVPLSLHPRLHFNSWYIYITCIDA
jgi:hypothetical protein